jgi:hypothetical protein
MQRKGKGFGSSPQEPHEGSLRETPISSAMPSAPALTSFDPFSSEAKARRTKLLADLKSGYTAESERALASLAEHCLRKT